MNEDQDDAVSEFEAYIAGTQIYVQPGGCLELAQQRNLEAGPEIVHICSDDWTKVVEAANQLLAKRNGESATTADDEDVDPNAW